MKVLLFFILIFVTLSDAYYVNARESAEESTFLEPFFFEYETYDNEELKEISKEWGDFHYAERKYEPYKYTYDKKNKNILIFDLTLNMFEKFIENPTEEFLKNVLSMSLDDNMLIGECSYKNIIEKGEDDFCTYIYPTIINAKNYYVYGSEMFDHRYHDNRLVFRKALIDYLDIHNLNRVLHRKGIDEKVQERAMVETCYYNLVIWIKTEKNIYLLEMKEPDRYNSFELYSVDEFKNIFTPKNGKLIIDDVEIPGNDNVIFYKDYALIKARPIWEVLGGSAVIWNEEDRSVSFKYKNKKLQFKQGDDNDSTYYTYFENNELFYEYCNFKPYLNKNGHFYWRLPELVYCIKKTYDKELESDSKLNIVRIK